LRDVFNVHEDVELEIGRLNFLGLRLRMEAGLQVVLFLGANLLKRVGPDVMVGHHEAVRRYKRTRTAAVEADGRFANMFEPLIGGVEAVFILEKLFRRVVEQPHTFVGADVHANPSQRRGQNKPLSMQHVWTPWGPNE